MTNIVVSVLSAEALSFVICLILLYGNIVESKMKTHRSKLFSVEVIINMIALIADALSWVIDGYPQYIVLNSILCGISIVFTIVLLGEFSLYMGVCVFEKNEARRDLLYKTVYTGTFITAITIVLCFTGKVYFFDEHGYYQSGPLYPLYLGINLVSIALSALIAIKNRKVLGKRAALATGTYILVPLICNILSLFFLEASFGFVSSTVALLVVYVFLQAEENRNLELQKNTSQYNASHDELTGLYSRRAYSERIDELVNTEGNMGIIYCDVNGLKYTNDHFGHKAGDMLLVDFAKKLTIYFAKEEVYRISGDEFVIFVVNGDKKYFFKKVIDFESDLKFGDEEIACVGDEFGSKKKVEDLILMAENKMYEKKEEYHKLHPESRR